ncbi:glycoside hydrolase family 2 protein [Albibacterium profundi]|uniref:beta-mannosidase n=1 Tax=Albibacterium profundi TaxID=3134906 RepID=A0ABV5CDX1_9SPHI
MRKILLLFFFLHLCSISSAQLYREYLLSDWVFKSTESKYWLPAQVPGNSVDDLLLNGKTSVNKADTTWQYRTTFIADKQIMSRDFVELLFEGLDTRATVYLNQEKILEANNMFRSWSVPVKPWLKEGDNELLIEFEADDYTPSLRKAFYHYDSGLSLIPAGIWKPIILESWNDYRLDDVSYKVEEIKDKVAYLDASIEFRTAQNLAVDIEIYDEVSGRTFARENITFDKDSHRMDIPFTIRRPKLWWPKALGKPNLYKIGVRVKGADNEQTLGKRIGIRTIQVDGASRNDLRISINDKPVLVKQTDYRPFLINISSQNTTDYEAIFKVVESLGKTMVRVLGVGVYENEYFYDLADVHGIMILQDFMFVPTDYPKTESFLKNVKTEALENIKSLQHHPSIVAWGGVMADDLNPEDESSAGINAVLKESLKQINPSYIFLPE